MINFRSITEKRVTLLNNNLGGLSFYEDTDGNKYVVGADSVPKKLGNVHTIQIRLVLQYFDSGKVVSASLIADGVNVAYIGSPNYGTGSFPHGMTEWYSNLVTLD